MSILFSTTPNSPPHNQLSLQSKNQNKLRYQRLYCQPNPDHNPTDSSPKENLVEDPASENDSEATVSPNAAISQYPNKDINRRVAAVSVLGAVGLFLSSRLDLGVSLKDQSAVALPYEEALSNGKPTVVEFYADWCEVCRELAPEVYTVEQQYKNKNLTSLGLRVSHILHSWMENGMQKVTWWVNYQGNI